MPVAVITSTEQLFNGDYGSTAVSNAFFISDLCSMRELLLLPYFTGSLLQYVTHLNLAGLFSEIFLLVLIEAVLN